MPDLPAGVKRIRGISGTLIALGQIANGSRDEMTLDEWLTHVNTMLKNPIIKSARDARMQTLKSASIGVKSGMDGDSEADKYAEFVAENLGLNGHAGMMDASLEEQLDYLYRYEDVGFRYAEPLWRRPTSPDGFIRLAKLADRMPSAHDKWIRRNSELHSVQQKAYYWLNEGERVGTAPVIPAEKLLLLTREMEGDNYEGVGTLEAVLYEAKLTHHAMSMLGVALERWGLQTPIVSWSYKDIQEDIAGMELKAEDVVNMVRTTMKKYMAQEESVILKPKGFEIDVYGSGELKLEGYQAIEDLITRRIQYAYLVQFMSLGQGSTGARSVGETQLDFFYEGAANGVDYVLSRINGRPRPGAGIVGRLIEYNFGPVDPRKLPYLVHSGLRTTPLMQALNHLGGLKQHNLISESTEFERLLMEGFGAELSEETWAMIDETRQARLDYIRENAKASMGPTTTPQP